MDWTDDADWVDEDDLVLEQAERDAAERGAARDPDYDAKVLEQKRIFKRWSPDGIHEMERG